MTKTEIEEKTGRKRGKSGRFVPKDKPAETAMGAAEQGGAPGADPDPDPYKHLPPRSRVKKAQEMVLDQMRNIVEGNCNSAKKGNYNAAKFVLDWAGITEIRTPLAKPKQRFSLAQLLRKRTKGAKEEPGDQS